MTEWVTIKIPKETRDAAREDSRTYEEIMREGLGKYSEPDTTPLVLGDAIDLQDVADAFGGNVGASPDAEEIAREVWRQADEAMIERVVRNAIQSELGQ